MSSHLKMHQINVKNKEWNVLDEQLLFLHKQFI